MAGWQMAPLSIRKLSTTRTYNSSEESVIPEAGTYSVCFWLTLGMPGRNKSEWALRYVPILDTLCGIVKYFRGGRNVKEMVFINRQMIRSARL